MMMAFFFIKILCNLSCSIVGKIKITLAIMIEQQKRLTFITTALPFVLFLAWFLFLAFSPVVLHPDSISYQLDADHFTDPGWGGMRPPLFPFFLRLTQILGIKLSIATFLVNVASLVCFLLVAGYRQPLFSQRNLLLLTGFFLLPALWSFSGAKLTESIIPAVEAWIFILMIKLYFPRDEVSVGRMVLYALAACLLSILLKPWIMFFTVVSACLLLVSGLLFRSVRFVRLPSLILLVVAGLSYAQTFKYSMSKSPMSGNMVLLLCSDPGRSAELRERAGMQTDTNSETAVMYRTTAADIDLTNTKYHGDPFQVPPAEMQLLRFTDPNYNERIKQAFMKVYFSKIGDMWGLARLGLSRYIGSIGLGWSCLQNAGDVYGPNRPWFKWASLTGILLLIAAGVFYGINWRRENPATKALPGSGFFALCTFLSGVLFALFLCLTGGMELARTVMPAIFLQLLAGAFYFINRFPEPAGGAAPDGRRVME
jgi:hypothetical protein